MNNSAQNKNHSLMEAYYAVYDENIRNELNEEKEIKEFLEVIDLLIEDGYDLSEYTYEELYEFHITERLGALLGGAARGIGTLLKKSGGKIYQGAKEPAKKVLTKLGKLAVPTAIAAGLDQYLTGGKVRDYTGSAIQGIRQMGHSIPTPGQAADVFKAPETTKPSPSRRNLPPAHLTQGYSYGKNNIITEDPAFPSQKPKGGDWSKLTIGGTTKLWDPETNSYQLPGTINKRLKSQGEKEITVPGKAPKPTPSPAPSPSPKPTPAPGTTPPRTTPAPGTTLPARPSVAPAATKPAIERSPQGYAVGTTSGGTKFERRAATGAELRAAQAARDEAKAAGNVKGAEEAAVKAGVQRSQPTTGSASATVKPASGTFTSRDMNKYPLKPVTPTQAIAAAPSTSPTASGSVAPITKTIASAPTTPPVAPKKAPDYSTREGDGKLRRPEDRLFEGADAYNIVLEYLFDNGDANTIAEAEYLMTELDENFIQSLVETYEANLLAEEVTAWVNELVEEGYDLSEYTWDDMVDYYFTEARVDTGLSDDEKIETRRDRRTDDSPSLDNNDKEQGRQWVHRFQRGMKKPQAKSGQRGGSGKYAAMQRRKGL
jgi:hypothetical protein